MAHMAETPEVGLLKEDCASQISTTGQGSDSSSHASHATSSLSSVAALRLGVCDPLYKVKGSVGRSVNSLQSESLMFFGRPVESEGGPVTS